MFKDTQKELQRLEAQLMEEEEREEEDALLDDDDDFGEESPEVYRNFSNRYKAYNTDRTDCSPEELGEELERKPKRGLALFLLLLAGVIGLLAWWYFGGGL